MTPPDKLQFRPRHGTARLTLTLNGQPYGVSPIPITPDTDESVTKAFEVRSPRGGRYHVAQTSDGITCDCPDYVFHRADYDPAHVGRGCKHILALVSVGLLDDE
jgi:hypothetical protein